MYTEQELKKKIMRRVYRVYIMRRVSNPLLRGGLLIVALGILSQVVSIRDVVLNAQATNGLSGFTTYVYSAFTTTETLVLILTSVSIMLVLWFFFEQLAAASRELIPTT